MDSVQGTRIGDPVSFRGWKATFHVKEGSKVQVDAAIPRRKHGNQGKEKGVNLYGGHIIKRMRGIHHKKYNPHSIGKALKGVENAETLQIYTEERLVIELLENHRTDNQMQVASFT